MGTTDARFHLPAMRFAKTFRARNPRWRVNYVVLGARARWDPMSCPRSSPVPGVRVRGIRCPGCWYCYILVVPSRTSSAKTGVSSDTVSDIHCSACHANPSFVSSMQLCGGEHDHGEHTAPNGKPLA